MAHRLGPLLFAAAVLVAVLAPVLGSPQRDSFPLSTYPMFARDRGADARVDTVVARTVDDARRRLSPEAIAATDEPIQAAAAVSRSIRAGAGASLCREVAGRLPTDDGLVRVEVVTERHDLDRAHADDPVAVVVHASCPVGR